MVKTKKLSRNERKKIIFTNFNLIESFFKQLINRYSLKIAETKGYFKRRKLIKEFNLLNWNDISGLIQMSNRGDFVTKKRLIYAERKIINFYFKMCEFGQEHREIQIIIDQLKAVLIFYFEQIICAQLIHLHGVNNRPVHIVQKE